MINIEQLHHAVRLAFHGNFTRAAHDLHISQPTLSRSIQKLENLVGAPIFTRSKAYIQPTLFGEGFLLRAAKILSDVNKLKEDSTKELGLLRGEIIIASGTFVEELFLAEVCTRINKQLPNVQVKILIYDSTDFINRLYSKEIDILIGEKKLIEKDRSIQVLPLKSQVKGEFFCRAGHPLLKKKHLKMKDIVQYPYVGLHLPARIARNFPKDIPFGTMRGDILSPKICCQNFTLQKKIVASSDCVGICVQNSIEAEINQNVLALLKVDQTEFHTEFGISYLKERRLSQLDKAVIDIVNEVDEDRV